MCDNVSLLGLALNNKFLPVHCVVTRDQCPQRVLQDGFVIVPSQTIFQEIVSVVLQSLEGDIGKIDDDERVDGKSAVVEPCGWERRDLLSGEILIKNWNPLAIGAVTKNRSVTVQEILGDLMNIAILKIRISK